GRNVDRIAMAIVHLELGGLEVPNPERDFPFGGERVHEPEAGILGAADVAAEQRQHLRLVGVHDEDAPETDRADQEQEDTADDPDWRLGFGRAGHEPDPDPDYEQENDDHGQSGGGSNHAFLEHRTPFRISV